MSNDHNLLLEDNGLSDADKLKLDQEIRDEIDSMVSEAIKLACDSIISDLTKLTDESISVEETKKIFEQLLNPTSTSTLSPGVAEAIQIAASKYLENLSKY